VTTAAAAVVVIWKVGYILESSKDVEFLSFTERGRKTG
jgi:hypothetical protein